MELRWNRRAAGADEEGFTLLELMVAMLISSIALVALASALTGGMRTVAIQKTRTQGNEIATEGIEDLQRYDYDHLGVCATEANPPAGFATHAPLANCGGAIVYTNPCSSPGGVTSVPATMYDCTRRGQLYTVKRFVSYGDAAQTTKRLAVVVTWTDSFGRHEVSQQSSLRSPTEASIIGLSPPSVTTASASSSQSQFDSTTGHLTAPIQLTATTQGLAAGDSLVAGFKTMQDGVPTDTSVAFSTVDGLTWSAVVQPGAHVFGPGSQYFFFNAVRRGDGKGNSRVATPAHRFCPNTPSGCDGMTLPAFVGSPTVAATADIDPAGVLLSDIPISVSTVNTTTADRVSMVFQTQAGAVNISLQPNQSACTTSSCQWTGVVSKTAGYRFNAGSQTFYFTASQVMGPDPVDIGSTAAAPSAGQVNFR